MKKKNNFVLIKNKKNKWFYLKLKIVIIDFLKL